MSKLRLVSWFDFLFLPLSLSPHSYFINLICREEYYQSKGLPIGSSINSCHTLSSDIKVGGQQREMDLVWISIIRDSEVTAQLQFSKCHARIQHCDLYILFIWKCVRFWVIHQSTLEEKGLPQSLGELNAELNQTILAYLPPHEVPKSVLCEHEKLCPLDTWAPAL